MYRMRQISALFIILSMLSCLYCTGAIHTAYADDYYADIIDGTDQAGCGPQASPCRTLHYIISNFVDGDDTVYMAAGTYDVATEDNSQLVIDNNNVIIRGDTNGSTIIDGYSTGEPAWTTGIQIGTVGSVITGVIIQNITITNFQNYGMYIVNCSPEIKHNIFIDNPTAIYVYGYMSASSPASPIITNNLIYEETSNTMNYGIQVVGLATDGEAYPLIYHNTIDGGIRDGIQLDEDVSPIEPTIKYNIITGFGQNGISYDGSNSPVIDYNCLFNNTVSNYTGITGGSGDIIDQDTLYEDPSTHDYHLQSASPCIDAIPSGDAETGITDDLDGNERPSPVGGDYDIGCYEFVQGPPPAVDRPATPTNESPDDYEAFPDTTTGVTLEGSPFSDPNGNTHAETEWRVKREDRGVYNCDDYDASFNAAYTSGTGLTSHDIAGLTGGMQYVWQVRYRNSNGDWSRWSEEYRFSIGTSAQDNSVELEGGTDLASYKMVSFPLWPDDSLCEDFFNDELGGSYDTTQMRLGTYDAETETYVECGSGMTVKPGRSYWFLSRNDMGIDVNGIPVATDLDVEVGLQYNTTSGNGWNMIACPNTADYDWMAVEVLVSDTDGGVIFGPTPVSDLADDNEYISTSLWQWKNGDYLDDTQTMNHHEGYWVNARTENVYLKFRADMAIAAAGSNPTMLSRTFTRVKKWIAAAVTTRRAVASGETPPLPPGVHDEPETKSCFIHAVTN